MNLFEALGRRIAQKMLDEKLSYRAVATSLGISLSVFFRASNGKPVSVENYLRIVEWLEK